MKYTGLEKKIYAGCTPEQRKIIQRVAVSGQTMLFDKSAHDSIFSELAGTPENLGSGIANLMVVLYGKSNESMPRGAVEPAGAIIMAKTADFMAQAGAQEVDDSAFDSALQKFIVNIHTRLDRDYKAKVAKMTGNTSQPPQPEAPAQQETAQPTGILGR